MSISPERRTWLAPDVRKLAGREECKDAASDLLWRSVLIETGISAPGDKGRERADDSDGIVSRLARLLS